MAAAIDSKSIAREGVGVQVPPPAPKSYMTDNIYYLFFYFYDKMAYCLHKTMTKWHICVDDI